MTPALRSAIERAFAALHRRGYLTTLAPDTTGVICAGFDADPDAPGYACVVAGTAERDVTIDAGAGVGDDDEDAAVALVVQAALEAEGLVVARDGTGCMLTARLTDGGGE
ncbi:MAG: hypothetical protein AB7T63_17940 [Planctomycetota bacterium]